VRTGSFAPFTEIDLDLPDRRDGKVRHSWAIGDDQRLIVTTDRLSAFDRVLAGVAYKGQVLNQLSAWWFDRTADIVPNHVVGVGGHITGVTDTSIWGMYAEGRRSMYGYDFPDGLRKNTPLPQHIVTPTTKAFDGGHDEPLSCAEVVERSLLPADLWERVLSAALAIFGRGVELGARAGLILADTKYEFGVTADDELILIDEVHTPDSSRWWVADTYEERLAAGEEPESLDKEVVRRAFAAIGYRGNGPVPEVDPDVWTATTQRYISAYERLTGTYFEPGSYPVADRLVANLEKAGLL
jgi:phosphoribosylaminoimidazole-succinocarboxamide synthase